MTIDLSPTPDDLGTWQEPAERAEQGFRALASYPDPSEPIVDRVGDLLADLLHLIDEQGEDSAAVLERAIRNYRCERTS